MTFLKKRFIGLSFLTTLTFILSMRVIDDELLIVFYNVENLFDTLDDSTTRDEDFTPDGKYGWTEERYQEKLANLAKALSAVDENKLPVFIGLCEIENETNLKDLALTPPLKNCVYKFIHKNSPDRRGIDVAAMYDSSHFHILHQEFIEVIYEGSEHGAFISRDILYAKFDVDKKDTIHIFLNHWPSRLGGQEKSEYKRVIAAQLLKIKVDSVKLTDPNARILIMGDFNDQPINSSILTSLMAKKAFKQKCLSS